jgi:flagellar biosynthetic protein FliQ
MDPQQVVTIARDGLLTLITVVGPLMLVVLAVGLVVSVFQAATQIHEQTLSFVPKLLAAFATLGVAGPWMLNTLVEYIQQVLQSIPSVVG